MINRASIVAPFLSVALLSPVAAMADSTFNASGGNLAGTATFAVSGDILTITLTNSAAADVLVPADVMTSLFFRTSGGSPAFVPMSATLGAGATVVYGTSPADQIVGKGPVEASGVVLDAYPEVRIVMPGNLLTPDRPHARQFS